jgi:hypothetical protein
MIPSGKARLVILRSAATKDLLLRVPEQLPRNTRNQRNFTVRIGAVSKVLFFFFFFFFFFSWRGMLP